MPRVLITPTHFRHRDAGYFKSLREAGVEIVFPSSDDLYNPAVLIRELQGIDAVLASNEPYTPEVIKNSKLRVIARAGVGFDSVDIPTATERNVLVTITPGAVEVSVAEQTMAMLLGIYRDVPGRDREVRAGVWHRACLPRLSGHTFGIVGLGRIGKAIVPRAQAFGLKVLAHDPVIDANYCAANNITVLSLDEVFQQSDILSLHLPNTPQTFNLINERTLKLMKPDAVLINLGRGALVDEDALYAAMKAGHLKAAALDVFKVEPLPISSPLLTLPNVLLAPHTGGLDGQSEFDMPRIAAECIANLVQNRWPEGCVINSQLRETWRF